MTPTALLVTASILGVVGIGGILVGVLVPSAVDTVFESAVKDQVVIRNPGNSEGNAAYKDWKQTPQGKTWGGDDENKDDLAVQYSVYISNITNLHAVLTTGAIPTVESIGPYKFRRYANRSDIEFLDDTEGNENGWVRYRERRNYVKDTSDPTSRTDSRFTTDTVIVPNAAHFALVSTFQSRGLPDLESALIPTFFPSAVPTITTDVGTALKVGYLPVTISTLVQNSIASGPYSNTADMISAFVSGNTTVDSTKRDVRLVLPPFPGFDSSTYMSSVVAQDLFTSTSNVSVVSPEGINFYISLLPTDVTPAGFAALLQHPTPALISATSKWIGGFASDDNRYNSNPNLATLHIVQTMAWLASYLAEGSTSPQGLANENVIVNVISGNDASVTTFSDAVISQLASNTAIGSLVTTPGAPYASISDKFVFGVTANNTCPTGVALRDLPGMAARLPTNVEYSCVTTRAVSNLDQMIGTKFYAGTKLSVSEMSTMLGLFTSGSVMFDGAPPGSMNVATLLGLANQLQTSDPQPTGAAFNVTTFYGLAAQRYGAIRAAASGGLNNLNSTYYNAVDAYQGLMDSSTANILDTACSSTLQGAISGAPALGCVQIFDLANWVQKVAHELVYYPNFVWMAPSTQTAAAFGTPGTADRANLRSGPYVRLTPAELILNGYQDALFTAFANQTKFPPLGIQDQYATYQDWLASNPVYVTMETGAGDISKLGRIVQHNNASELTLWGETTEVKGSIDGTRFPPRLSRKAQEDASPNPVESVWILQVLRAAAIQYDEDVKGPNGYVKRLWRYSFRDVGSNVSNPFGSGTVPVIGTFKSDVTRDAPRCIKSIAAMSGLDLYIGVPYGFQCTNAEQNMMVNGPTPNQADHGTYVDIEPISGLTLNARKRLGAYQRYGRSRWFPNMPAAPFYHQIFYAEEAGVVPAHTEKDLQNNIDMVNTLADVVLPVVGIVLGAICILAAGVLIYKRVKRQSQSRIQNDKKTNKEQQDLESNPVSRKYAPQP